MDGKWVAAMITVALAIGTLSVGLRAAFLWWLAGHNSSLANTAPEDQVELHVTLLQGDLASSALLNSAAAKWTAFAAGLGALTSVWSSIAPLVFAHP